MSLPNPAELISQMATRLKAHLEHRGISEPRYIGIRTGGVWVAQALLQARKVPIRKHVALRCAVPYALEGRVRRELEKVHAAPVDEIRQHLMRQVQGWMDIQRDDISLVVARQRG